MRQAGTVGEFTCAGVYTSAALLVTGCRLLRVQRVDGTNRVVFVFEDVDDKPAQTLRQYWDGNLLVDAKRFADAIYQLRRQASTA